MIDSIRLFNFQCHSNLTLECDRITTLIGPSDSGKSAVLRAIDWVLFNHGTATTYLKRNTKTVAVQLVVDGISIVRSSKNNSYKFNDLEYHAVGKSIPEDIVEFLKVSEDNIQRQHNSLYWFTDSGSTIMSNLNRIVDLSKLDEWTHTAQSKIRQQTQKETILTETIANQEKTIEALQAVPSFDTSLATIEARYADLTKINARYKQIKATFTDLTALTTQAQGMRQYVAALQTMVTSMYNLLETKRRAVDICISLRTLSEIQKQLAFRPRLTSLLNTLQANQNLCAKKTAITNSVQKIVQNNNTSKALCAFIQSLRALLTQHEALDRVYTKRNLITAVLTYRLPPSPVSLQNALEALNRQQIRYKQLNRDVQTLTTSDELVKTKQQEHSVLQTDFTTQLDGQCPICGQAFCGDHS